MIKKKYLRSKKGPKSYAKQLLSLSTMGNNEKKRWERVIPSMNNDELGRLEGVLENEVSELADIYLKVLQRRSESRVFDYATELGDQTVVAKKAPVQNQASQDEEINSPIIQEALALDEGDKEKEMRVLERLVKGASFVPESKKMAMLEVSRFMPSYVLKDLQEVIIREGLKKLKQKKSSDKVDPIRPQFSLVNHKNVVRIRGFLSNFLDEEFILETRMGHKYYLLSDSIKLAQYTDREVELEGFKDESNINYILVNKIRSTTS